MTTSKKASKPRGSGSLLSLRTLACLAAIWVALWLLSEVKSLIRPEAGDGANPDALTGAWLLEGELWRLTGDGTLRRGEPEGQVVHRFPTHVVRWWEERQVFAFCDQEAKELLAYDPATDATASLLSWDLPGAEGRMDYLIAARGRFAYLVLGGQVYRADLEAGSLTAQEAPVDRWLAEGEDFLILPDREGSALLRLDWATGAVETLADLEEGDFYAPVSACVGGGTLYYAGQGGALFSLPLDGSAPPERLPFEGKAAALAWTGDTLLCLAVEDVVREGATVPLSALWAMEGDGSFRRLTESDEPSIPFSGACHLVTDGECCVWYNTTDSSDNWALASLTEP